MQARSFYEKGFVFAHNDKVYRYSCLIPNSTEKYPLEDQTVRAETFYNCAVMWRDQETQKVRLDMIC